MVVKLNKMEIWMQVHDLSKRFMSENILKSIGILLVVLLKLIRHGLNEDESHLFG